MSVTSVDFRAPGATVPPELQWRPSIPTQAGVVDGVGLHVQPSPNTDAWMRTHYGFENSTAQQLGVTVTGGDFVAMTRVHMHPKLQYDQAGLFVWFSNDEWIKTSCEYIPGGTNKLGSVVTQRGYSDWATSAVDGDQLTFEFRIARLGDAYLIHTRRSDSQPWFLARLARLSAGSQGTCHVGLYACCPSGAGGHAVFEMLEVRPPFEGEVKLHD
jgi:regulation of enolase protein 1 (concanavalin A-like superfamily)